MRAARLERDEQGLKRRKRAERAQPAPERELGFPDRWAPRPNDLLQPTAPGMLRLQRAAGNSAVAGFIMRACMLQDPPPPRTAVQAPPPGLLAPPPAKEAEAPKPEAKEPEGAKDAAGPTKPAAVTHKTVRYGSKGGTVKELQQKLNDSGASPPLVVDGIFGPKTRAATVTFQKSQSLEPDGIVGPLTWGALDKFVSRDDETRKDLLSKVTITVVEHGASGDAVAAAKAIQDQEWKNLDTPSLRRIVGLTVELHVIPHDKKMTDLDEFKALKGTTTFDGRLWDDVRGINMGRIGDKIISAVGEETLVTIAGKPAGYALGFVAAHESGHAIRQAMTPAQDEELVLLYDTRVVAKGKPDPPKAGDPADDLTLDDWLAPRWYTASNADEYLAQSVSAFFGHPYSDDKDIKEKYTRDWLQKNDPGMYKFLAEQIYKKGTP